MADISAEMVKQLRLATNVSMMECKRALVEADGDPEKARRLLRERGMAVAAQKATRAANQGRIVSASSNNGAIMSLVEVNCETDFVSRNEGFGAFAAWLAERACATDGSLAEEASAEAAAKVAEIGENIVVRRNMRYVLKGTGRIGSYIHLGGKVGVLVDVACGKEEVAGHPVFKELVKDLTLHIAASAPRFLAPADVSPEELASEREIYAKQIQGNKPPQVIEKIVEGKLKKFFATVCLVDQPFVREPKTSVASLLKDKGKELGDTLAIRRFARFQLGE